MASVLDLVHTDSAQSVILNNPPYRLLNGGVYTRATRKQEDFTDVSYTVTALQPPPSTWQFELLYIPENRPDPSAWWSEWHTMLAASGKEFELRFGNAAFGTWRVDSVESTLQSHVSAGNIEQLADTVASMLPRICLLYTSPSPRDS